MHAYKRARCLSHAYKLHMSKAVSSRKYEGRGKTAAFAQVLCREDLRQSKSVATCVVFSRI